MLIEMPYRHYLFVSVWKFPVVVIFRPTTKLVMHIRPISNGTAHYNYTLQLYCAYVHVYIMKPLVW